MKKKKNRKREFGNNMQLINNNSICLCGISEIGHAHFLTFVKDYITYQKKKIFRKKKKPNEENILCDCLIMRGHSIKVSCTTTCHT